VKRSARAEYIDEDIAVSTKPAKQPTLEDYLTREEFRVRFVAEKIVVQRHYCTLFRFWRSCRHKPCRRARACTGDPHRCLPARVDEVPRHEQFQARQSLLQATPPNIAAPEHAARDLMPNSFADSWAALRLRDIPRGWRRAGKRRRRDGRGGAS